MREVVVHELPVDHQQRREPPAQPLALAGGGRGHEAGGGQLRARAAHARQEVPVGVGVGQDALQGGPELEKGKNSC